MSLLLIFNVLKKIETVNLLFKIFFFCQGQNSYHKPDRRLEANTFTDYTIYKKVLFWHL